MHASFAARRGDLVLAVALFAFLASLSWLRWASFQGDLSREWTVPMRLAAGERLWKDVGYYYGPLAPHAVAGAFRAFGSTVATYVGFGLLAAGGTLAAILVSGRRFLGPAASAGVAAVAVGVLAFAPENGAFVAPYAMAALLSIGLSWGAFLLAASGRVGLAGVAGALALLAKPEAAPALLGAALATGAWRAGIRLLAIAALLAASVYGVAMAGIPVAELVSYGPLRHLSMPPEFRELYLRVSGLHPALIARGAGGLLAGSALLAGWSLLATGLVSRRTRLGIAGGTLFVAGLLANAAALREPIVTTGVRGLPLLLGVAGFVAFVDLRRGDASARLPLAAVSALPAVAWLLGLRIPRLADASVRPRVTLFAVVPLLLAPLLFLPRLVLFYRAPRTEVSGPAGRWFPPGEEGELFSKLAAHLTRAGVKDRDLAIFPESGALGFLLGVRSPLRFEQVLPGHVDSRVDRDLAADLDRARPGFVVLVSRPTPEYGPVVFGRDYAVEIAARLARDYAVERRLQAGEMTAVVLRRR
ncbi:MAG TPA: hypothetical protein VE129_09330 [Thermoanaerobaculia bacterium]|nr:hypothetical protein [Thermoanaerobaculia bacterium]